MRKGLIAAGAVALLAIVPASAAAPAPTRASDPFVCPCALKVTPSTCVATAIFPARPSHLLVVVTGNQESVSGPGEASCRIAIDGVEETLAVHPGEANIDNTDVTGTNGFARTFMPADAVAEGKHNVALSCKLLNGQVRINEPTIAAIAIAAG